ncbi:hypothetical protein, partial [Sphingomonas sp. CCH5-D11]
MAWDRYGQRKPSAATLNHYRHGGPVLSDARGGVDGPGMTSGATTPRHPGLEPGSNAPHTLS